MPRLSPKFRLTRARLRRPSAAMMVALTALFLSLGGAGYAAIYLPAGSVGAAQLQTFAVTNQKIAVDSVGYRKIMPGAIGTVRIDKYDVQLRVTGTCTAANQAITSVNIQGGVTCADTSPTEADTGAGTQAAVTGANATLASYTLAGGTPYLVQAAPYIKVVSGSTDTVPETVTVTCTLAAGPSTTATQTRSVSVSLGARSETDYATVPLAVTAPLSANAINAQVGCSQSVTSGSGSPTVQGQVTLYALTINPTATTTTTTPTTTTTTTTTTH